ncbi:hypothetical protein AWH63_10305 [Marinobacter sp. C18]|uniref:hypothetical protein n=1 Tax=Marinobacter sp. C18 TaxID=1772288 RepID=UPI000948DC60|nr:hypothetical protein [Marinobacter sp. C18]OLF81924.1 hypothetical protein AWH63_10305 [Marinobacter sp. C18]
MLSRTKVKAPETTGSRADRVLGMRIAQVWLAVTTALLIPTTANAALSDWIENISNEFTVAVPYIVSILGLIGVALAGFGIISAVMAKKNQRPAFENGQGWFIGGGVLLVLLIPFVLAVGESMSGQDASNQLNSVLQ